MVFMPSASDDRDRADGGGGEVRKAAIRPNCGVEVDFARVFVWLILGVGVKERR
jgi:hypothetical protein